MSLLNGLAKRAGKTPGDFNARSLARGTHVEMEHTRKRSVAREIAMDHLTEDPRYYEKLAKMESSRDIQVIITERGSASKGKRQRYNPAKAKRKTKGKFVRPKPKGPSFAEKMKAKYGDKGTSLNTQDSARDPSRNGSVALLRTNGSFLRGWYSHDPADRRENERLMQVWARENGYGGAERRADGNWYCLKQPKGTGYRGVRDPSGLSRKRGRTSRDFSEDVRHLSLSALGRLLRQFHQRGDEAKCHVIEQEIDRRTKAFRGRR